MSKSIPHLNSLQLLSEIGVTDWDDKDFAVVSNLSTRLNIQYPFRCTDYIIGFVTEGSANGFINLQSFNLNKNSLIIITPFNIMDSIHQSDDLKISGITFTKNFITEHLADIHMLDELSFLKQGNAPVLPVSEEDVTRLNDFFSVMSSLAKDKKMPHRKKMIRTMLQTFLYGVDSIYQPEFNYQKKRLTRKEELNFQFQNLLVNCFEDQRSVSFYAEQLNVTAKYLSESVKEISGKTAGELIDDMVILEAKVLLKNSNLTIYQVADMLHFSDQFLFSKFFKNHTALSPSEYRKK